jgi:hypothetical protein
LSIWDSGESNRPGVSLPGRGREDTEGASVLATKNAATGNTPNADNRL